MAANRVAIVTGAASGIGRAVATRFLRGGYAVVAFDRDESRLQELTREHDDEFMPVVGRVEVVEDLDRLIKSITDRYGRLDALLQIAGIGCYKPLWEVTDEEVLRVFCVNTVSQIFLARRCVALLRPSKGAVVNMASVRAFRGGQELTVYSASKAAIIGMTRSMAHELGPAIRVNAVCPGTIDTPLLHQYVSTKANPDTFKQALYQEQPLRRIGTPDDVAEAVFYLGTPASRFITGAALTVDGGLTA